MQQPRESRGLASTQAGASMTPEIDALNAGGSGSEGSSVGENDDEMIEIDFAAAYLWLKCFKALENFAKGKGLEREGLKLSERMDFADQIFRRAARLSVEPKQAPSGAGDAEVQPGVKP